jgi:transposase
VVIDDIFSILLPDTFSELREHAWVLVQERNMFQNEIALLKKKLEIEKLQNEWFRRQLFGQKSERHISTEPVRQEDCFPGFEPTPAEKKPEQPTVVVAEHKRKATPKKKEFPWNAGVSGLRFNDSVDIEVVTCENPAIKDLSPDQYEVLGVETVDKLCQRKSSYFVRRYERPRVKIKETNKIVEPPPSPSVIRGSFMEPEFLAGIVVDKILYHLPLYRIHQRLKDGGIWIARSSLTNAFHAVGDLLQPIFQLHLESILSSTTLLADETKVKVGVDTQKHKMHTAYFWGLLGDKN